MSATLQNVNVIKRTHHGKRFGFMFSTRDAKSQFGNLGSKGRTYTLDVWRNPKS